MRTVTIDNINAVVDAEMCEVAQSTAVLAEESLGALWQMSFVPALCSAVERDDDYIRFLLQLFDDALHKTEVGMLHSVTVMTESTDAVLHTIALNHSILSSAGNARELNALLVKTTLCRLDACLTKVICMVVSHTQEVVTGICKQRRITCGCAECKTMRACALGACTAIAESTFEVAHSEVCTFQYRLRVIEKVGTIVGWQLT